MEMKDLKNKTKLDIETLATGLGILPRYEERETKDRGWVNEPKGMLQVLWERGWIDDSLAVTKHYTMTGRKYRYECNMPETSLQDLMKQCSDVINKRTLLQEYMFQLGITAI